MARRTLWPAALAALATLCLCRPAAGDESAGLEDEGLPTYEIVAEEPADQGTGPSVRALDREELERRGEQDAAAVLEHEPAINGTTGRRGERILTMRGFEQRQLVVLVDGAPAYIPYDGQVNLGLVPAEMIDHITVVKGPASVLYGPNGMGGAINIVTRRPGAGPLASVALETGLGFSLDLSGIHSQQVGRVGYVVHGGYAKRDAFPLPKNFEPVPRENGVLRDNSDRTVYHAGGGLRVEINPRHHITASANYLDGGRGVPPGLKDLDARYWRFSTWRTAGGTVSHAGSYLDGALELDEQFYLRFFDNLLDSFDDDTYSSQDTSQAFSSWYHDRMLGGRVRGRMRWDRTPWGITDLRVWLGVQNDRHSEEYLGQDPEPSHGRTLLTLAPEAEAYVGQRWSVVAGLQVDWELPAESSDGAAQVGALLSARWDPLDQLRLRATVARRSRFPTLREGFSTSGGTRKLNPDLGAESAWHLGLEGAYDPLAWLRLELALYGSLVGDLIVLETLPQDPEYVDQMQNVERVWMVGTELSLALSPLSWLEARAGYNFLYARRGEPRDGSTRLPERPAHRATLRLTVTPLSWLELSSSLRVIADQAYQNPASGTWRVLDPYVRWDARLMLRPLGRWVDLWLRVSNLLDSQLQTQYGFPEPGREIWVGLRGRWER